ncbi:transposase [Chitinasiproducens palmae]|uniref:Putative transposase n=1 Tax=Chitinasiproducens palmae TaxID=1770053 RepID=A0A1H2PL53_9BURK|nr:transposase [Chitinasiproducens palmae]SDV47211.1 putative transposase [Chitinasiproducens palmae]
MARRHAASEASNYAWRKRFGQMVSDDVKRFRTLETQNGRLKKVLAERDFETEAMKDINAKKL